MAEHHISASGSVKASASATATVIRGQASWTFLYVVAGFAVSIESTMVSMLDCIPWWARELLFIALAALTFWLILFNGRAQDRLLALKGRYENRAR